MNKRPPFLGYNHNVRHKGQLFHVQSEDSGLSRPVLTTHVFVDGTILATLRSTYTVDEADPVVQKRMQDQHKTMLKRVRDGEFDPAHGVTTAPIEPIKSAKPDLAASATAPATAAKPTSGKRLDGVPEHIPHEVAPETQRLPQRKAAPPPPPPPSRKDGPSASGSWSIGGAIAENARLSTGESTAELQPVQKAEVSQSLAARLKIGAAPIGVVPPPIAGSPVTAPSATSAASYAALQDEDIEPVVEMEFGSSDDDEPQLTIEAAEPTDEEAEAEVLSQATPLPAAVPLGHDETMMMGADMLIPPPRVGPFTVSVPFGPGVRPVYDTRPLSIRPLQTGALRARPTSEGVIVLCMGPVVTKMRARKLPKNPNDPLRSTQPHLRVSLAPTFAPAAPSGLPFAAVEPALPIDEKIMAFLRREAAR